MPPARRRLHRFKNAKKVKRKYIFLKLLIVLFIFIIPLFFLTRTKYWDGKSKLVVVVQGNGEVLVNSFDPLISEITTVKIPVNTSVEVARDLGTWKLGSVWKLAENEKIGGVLLQETIIKNFNFPVAAWAKDDAGSLGRGDLAAIKSTLTNPYITNLSVGDRVRLLLFATKVKGSRKKTIELSGSSLLRREKLVDGEDGYAITKSLPAGLIGVFADSEASGNSLRVSIRDATGKPGKASNVAGVIELLGAKVVAKNTEEAQNVGCVIYSNGESLVRLLHNVLGCKKEKRDQASNFDLEIVLGSKFAERF